MESIIQNRQFSGINLLMNCKFLLSLNFKPVFLLQFYRFHKPRPSWPEDSPHLHQCCCPRETASALSRISGSDPRNFEKLDDFSPDFSLELADATSFKFIYFPLRISIFSFQKGFCYYSEAEKLGEGTVLTEGRKITFLHVCFC